jgi:mannose-6-phosphate isomerase-like protein (cupin superfamily)
MIIIHADEVEGWVTPPPYHRTLKVLLSPTLHGTARELGMGMVILPPGQNSSPHRHETEQEVWYVVSGTGKARIGDEWAELRPDTIVVAPAGVEHQLFTDGEEDLKAIWLFSPAGPETQYLPPTEGETKVV